MKAYFNMFKYHYRMMPFPMFVFTGIFFITSILRTGFSLNLFENTDSIFNLVFVIVFAIGAVLFFVNYLCFFLYTNISFPVFRMIPGIRSKALSYSLVSLFIYFVWFLSITGITEIKPLIFILMLNFWFMSLLMSLVFYGKVSLFRSGKYIILKICFYLFSLVGIMFSAKHPEGFLLSVRIFQTGFFMFIIYQFYNFSVNYKYNNFLRKHSGRDVVGSIENFFLNINDKPLQKKLRSSQSSPIRNIKLFDITIFGVWPHAAYLVYPWIAWLFFMGILDHGSINPFISMIPLLSGFYLSTLFSNRDKICFLYTVSGLGRKEFVKTVLRTVLRRHILFFLPFLPLLIIYNFIYNQYFGELSYYIPVTIYIVFQILWALLTWIIWMASLQFKEFDKLFNKQKKSYAFRNFHPDVKID